MCGLRMSWVDEGDVPPHKKVGDLYDLNQWNEEFWTRFRNLIRWTHEMDIIVQIEVWATFSYYREPWDTNPFNPKNNSNYTAEETGLPTVVKSHPVATENNFFWSVPKERNQEIVLKYQEKSMWINFSLRHFSMGIYSTAWTMRLKLRPNGVNTGQNIFRSRQQSAGRVVETTEMWNPWELYHHKHRLTSDHPEIYSFCDVSQNNTQKRQTHWDNAQKYRAELSPIRPINNVKIYGADTGKYGKTQDGLARFWRNIFGGFASARFHRPPNGLGLSKTAQASLKSMRMIIGEMDIFTCEPHNDLLSNREENEAYTFANPEKEYAVYFPKGGSVDIDLSLE